MNIIYLECVRRSFPSLQYLSLAPCKKITDKGLQYLGTGRGCHKLICLDLSGCIQALVKCQQIMSVVFLDSPHLSDPTFKAPECKLIKVRIEGNDQISDLSFKLISKCCPYIRLIHIACCQMKDVGLKMISQLKCIHVLSVVDCLWYYIAPIFLCHQLTYLNLRHSENITDAGIEALGNMSSLMSTDISAINISDMGLRVLGCHGKIKQLSLAECKNFSDTGIQEYCKGTKHLEYCHISNCSQLTDEAVKYLAFYCHRLASVSLACCPKMTETCIQYLATACLYLHFLDVSGCINLTDKALKCLWKGQKQLILKMLYCRNITKQAALKYTAKLEKQEYNDADPPARLRYGRGGKPSPKNTSQTLTKQTPPNEE
ncbi:LOW QUALITY PROTEIN: F-box and leucine-rich repeat protein 13 [Mergus octosetaceus]